MTATRLGQRLLLVLFGFALSLVALEGVMQAGAVAVRLTGRKPGNEWLTGARRVLSLGDSFTYGLFVERAEAYPMAFERLWNSSSPDSKVEVLNLGFPGANSVQLRNELPHLLDSFAPDVLTLLVGANDYWTVLPEPEERGALDRFSDCLFRHSRVFRLAHMLRRSFHKTEFAVQLDADDWAPESRLEPARTDFGGGTVRFGDHTIDMGWARDTNRKRDHTNWTADVERNLLAMTEMARGRGVKVVFLTYPTGVAIYAQASDTLRRVAKITGAPLVDVTPTFAPQCPYWSCPLLFPDQHPTVEGHRIVARALFDTLHAPTPPPS